MRRSAELGRWEDGSLSTRLAAELRELQVRAGWNGSRPGCISSFPSTEELREVCYQVKALARLPKMMNGLQANA